MSDDPEFKAKCDAEAAMLDQHVHQLAEHWDVVHIFVCRHVGEKDNTRYLDRASGNWFTRYGHIKDWVNAQEERTRNRVRKEEAS